MSHGPPPNPDDQPTLPPHEASGDEDVEVHSAFDATIGHEGSGPEAGNGPRSNAAGEAGPLPELEDYQLLEELGRGGMGVVYRARHKSLDRTVALKMILGGQFASGDEVRRFQLEAESAARLDHPGIVPVYEVGSSQGNHFFSMKLIDGRALSDCAEAYLDSRDAVSMLIQVARAVQHAHERGVLHRDLKPANILVDGEGQPMLTDLGLAKRMDEDSGLTRTGLVMGSPGFMSPEQAAGESDVTTAADVYALGAILYWLITGRAPFQGETHLETIMQTIEQEPQSVQALRPDADRSLNLICQKALQKSPEERYVSAAAFADDLQAWLDGEPLSVRPPTTLELAQLWVRKHFRAVAVALGAGIASGLYIGGVILISILSQLATYGDLYTRLQASELPWALNYFGWAGVVPRWVGQMLPMTFTWVTTAIAITMIALIRPKSREIGMAAATMAGLLAGILSFSISLGWDPIVESSLRPSLQDTAVISNTFWTDDDRETELARRAIEQRYPGMMEIEPERRGAAMYSKIFMDQSFAIPLGIWRGIWLTLCIAVLPLFLAGSFASWIWCKGNRSWGYVGEAIELGIYSSLFCLLLVKTVSTDVGLFPGVGWQLLTMGGIVVAVRWALQEAHWPWRVLGFFVVLASVSCNFVVGGRIQGALQRLESASTETELQQAEKYLEQKVAQLDRSYDRYCLIALHAYLQHDQKYVAQCRRLLDRFENVFQPTVAEQLAKVWLLQPALHGDLKFAHELADIVVQYQSSEQYDWFRMCHALSKLRQGQGDQALASSQAAREFVAAHSAPQRRYLVATTYVVDALVHQQKGDVEAMQSSLKSLDIWLDRSADQLANEAAVNRFVYEVLRRELDTPRS